MFQNWKQLYAVKSYENNLSLVFDSQNLQLFKNWLPDYSAIRIWCCYFEGCGIVLYGVLPQKIDK